MIHYWLTSISGRYFLTRSEHPDPSTQPPHLCVSCQSFRLPGRQETICPPSLLALCTDLRLQNGGYWPKKLKPNLVWATILNSMSTQSITSRRLMSLLAICKDPKTCCEKNVTINQVFLSTRGNFVKDKLAGKPDPLFLGTDQHKHKWRRV